MKKILKLTTITLLLIFSSSCEKDDSELYIESVMKKEKSIESELESRAFKPTTCNIIGATSVTPGTTSNYSYTNDTGTSSSISWSLTSVNPPGSVTHQNGTLSFSSNFVSATLRADGTGGTALPCTASININRETPPCGIDINGIYELNLLGDENVAFYATTDVSSDWSLTGSFFTVTYQNGRNSYHDGYTNYYGHQQIIIPVSCSNRVRKVEVDVYGVNTSNMNCSDTRIRDWGSIGVCGTAGGWGFN